MASGVFVSRWLWKKMRSWISWVIEHWRSADSRLLGGRAALHCPLLRKGLHWRRRASCKAEKKSFLETEPTSENLKTVFGYHPTSSHVCLKLTGSLSAFLMIYSEEQGDNQANSYLFTISPVGRIQAYRQPSLVSVCTILVSVRPRDFLLHGLCSGGVQLCLPLSLFFFWRADSFNCDKKPHWP